MLSRMLMILSSVDGKIKFSAIRWFVPITIGTGMNEHARVLEVFKLLSKKSLKEGTFDSLVGRNVKSVI